MPRQPDYSAKIVVVGSAGAATSELVLGLRQESYVVRSVDSPQDVRADPSDADLVLIDAERRPDVVADVRVCRERWPEPTTTVLVLGTRDPDVSAAAIEAGATDSVADATGGPLLSAHVRRVLRAGETLKGLLDDEGRRGKREGLALAAADVAVPLGDLVDELEAVMARAPVDARLDELLELTGRAVDAVDRLRRLATASDGPPADHPQADGPQRDGPQQDGPQQDGTPRDGTPRDTHGEHHAS